MSKMSKFNYESTHIGRKNHKADFTLFGSRRWMLAGRLKQTPSNESNYLQIEITPQYTLSMNEAGENVIMVSWPMSA